MLKFDQTLAKPIVVAGPCAAESPELLKEVAGQLVELSNKLDFTLVFKASFDKANRSAVDSYRGPGLEQGLSWLADIKAQHQCYICTDVHETSQVEAIAEVADVIQIPAFLCRQTDLLVKAVQTKKAVSVKKGQFLAPGGTQHIVEKARTASRQAGIEMNLALMERGSSFGYENLVVDMRGLKTMASHQVPVLFDITHSTQQPSSGKVTGGLRDCAPLLARAAVATGYLSGIFMEVHSDPQSAKSDAATQLTIDQAKLMLTQLIPLFAQAKDLRQIDAQF